MVAAVERTASWMVPTPPQEAPSPPHSTGCYLQKSCPVRAGGTDQRIGNATGVHTRPPRVAISPLPAYVASGIRLNHSSRNTWISIRSRCDPMRSEEHTSELQSLMRIQYAVF